MPDGDSTLRAAYARCRRLAQRHYENFPVASYLVPRDKRDALAAIYAFARLADDFADEPAVGAIHQSPLQLLADWRRRLQECYGEEGFPASSAQAALPRDPGGLPDPNRQDVFMALADAVRRFGLSQEHFENLLRAFESDVTVHRHKDFTSLLNYCACSANPVGRLVLELFGHRDPGLVALSDDLCTGLQLANFWQDVEVDLRNDRVYLPLEDLEGFKVSLEVLKMRRVDPRWRELMAFEVRRARGFFERSRLLPEKVVPSLRIQLRLTWLGGMTILRKIEAVGYDVFRRRPRLGLWDFLRLYLKARHADLSRGDAEEPAATVSRP